MSFTFQTSTPTTIETTYTPSSMETPSASSSSKFSMPTSSFATYLAFATVNVNGQFY